jgi:hypothetical protein
MSFPSVTFSETIRANGKPLLPGLHRFSRLLPAAAVIADTGAVNLVLTVYL